MLTLLWGQSDEDPVAAVASALADMGAAYVIEDQPTVDLDSVSSCYVRPYGSRRARVSDDALLGWLDVTPALVVNRPAAMLLNGSKPAQLARIARYGFAVPPTLVTTSPEEVERFWRDHREVIYKSVSGVRSRVARLTAAHRERLADVTHCPTQFQAYIAGVDVRVHVVGDQAFASEVRSAADDYRYASDGVAPPRITATILPASCRDRCVAMARDMGLLVAGIDLRRTKDGTWYCFEVNPSPAFTYYQGHTGQPMAMAIARLLAGR